MAISGSSYASDRYVNVSLADGDYFTIDGMNDTSLSGPTTSVSQTITVYISPTSSVGSYLATTTTPSCSISTTVTSKKHLAQACLNVRVLNTAMCSYLTVYYNGTSKQISSTGIYYFDPTVTSIATYTHSNLSISRKSYARAYIGIVGTTSSTTYGSYTYKGADSTSTWSGYLADVTATCSIGDTYGNAYMVLVDYLSYTISAPTIKTCTDAGS